jgi:hypothetical protein
VVLRGAHLTRSAGSRTFPLKITLYKRLLPKKRRKAWISI